MDKVSVGYLVYLIVVYAEKCIIFREYKENQKYLSYTMHINLCLF